VRLKVAHGIAAMALALLVWPARAAAQNPDTMMPDESAAYAKKLLGQLVTALGGPAYLHVKEMQCAGRLAQFEHSGNLSGYTIFRNYWDFPDKNRAEYETKSSKLGVLSVLVGSIPIKGGTLIQVYSGDQGWTLDRGGVSPLAPELVSQFQESLKRSVDQLLRFRMKQEDLSYRYGGLDLIDMLPVDWVEVTDSQERKFRLAIRRSDHLLIRSVVTTEDQARNDTTDEVTIFANYHPLEGVQTPLQVTRVRDGRKLFQVFYNSCSYDPTLAGDLFTQEGLEKRFAQVGSRKEKDRAAKEKAGQDDN
jgi:hypothetical protein